MKRAIHTGLLLSSLLVFGACTAEVKVVSEKRKVMWDYESGGAVSVDEIKKRLEEEPDNPQPYFLMAMHLESVNQLTKAINYYLGGIERFKNLKLPDDAQYTGGHYRVGRCYARLRGYNQAIVHLGMVKAIEPKDLPSAMANRHFRETRFLLGACYNEVMNYTEARKHFIRFIELGGEEWRAADFIFRIDQILKEQAESGKKEEARDPLEVKKG